MEKYYTTGQFAKKASTTERTIRYYDKIGLLKPTRILANGYRQYTEKDFLKLQRIIMLQHLGFSLEEIYPMLLNNNPQNNFKESIELQIEMVNRKINYLEGLKESLIRTNKLLHHGKIEWDRVTDLIRMMNEENMIVRQYQGVNNLLFRIRFHKLYSINLIQWFEWILSKMDFSSTNKLLEIGCGTGDLWENSTLNLRHREFFLTDINNNMLEVAKKTLGDDYNYMVMDCEDITFKKSYFDIVLANHVLFYLNDLHRGLQEVKRVLKTDGIFYCTVYSQKHMQEIELIVKEYNPNIYLRESRMYEKFDVENGKELLSNYFSNVTFYKYEDYLQIDDAEVLIEYIMSCPGNQNEILGKKIEKFRQYIEDRVKEKGWIMVTEDMGIFICKNKY
jgi:DNA-binding transcriptional MerR regulator/ubiquinone/menaquinone biosynthesis C-methylase UbiE